MDISGEYTLYAPRERVWNLLLDPDVLRRTIPGCEQLDPRGDDTYHVRLNVGIAAVKGIYTGTLQIADRKPPESYRMTVEGSGTRGVLHGDGTLSLEARDASTTVVRYSGQAQLGGAIASVGMRMAGGVANMLIKSFFARLADEVAGGPAAVSVPADVVKSAIATGAAAPLSTAASSVMEADTSRTVPTAAAASGATSTLHGESVADVSAARRKRGPLVQLIRRVGISDGTMESEQHWARVALVSLVGLGFVALAATIAALIRIVKR